MNDYIDHFADAQNALTPEERAVPWEPPQVSRDELVDQRDRARDLAVRLIDQPEPAVSGGAREALDRAIGAVLFNTSNFPEKAQVRLLGQDMGPLRARLVDAVVGSEFARHVAAETLRDVAALFGKNQTITEGEVREGLLNRAAALSVEAPAETPERSEDDGLLALPCGSGMESEEDWRANHLPYCGICWGNFGVEAPAETPRVLGRSVPLPAPDSDWGKGLIVGSAVPALPPTDIDALAARIAAETPKLDPEPRLSPFTKTRHRFDSACLQHPECDFAPRAELGYSTNPADYA